MDIGASVSGFKESDVVIHASVGSLRVSMIVFWMPSPRVLNSRATLFASTVNSPKRFDSHQFHTEPWQSPIVSCSGLRVFLFVLASASKYLMILGFLPSSPEQPC